MAKQIQLEIPQGCSESWDAMSPSSEGRYCSSCQKTITDFTGMNDAELARWLQQHPGGGCGRFYASQLGHPLTLPRKPLPGLRLFFTVTLPAFLLSLKAAAQNSRQLPVSEVSPKPPQQTTPPATAKLRLVTGKVIALNGYPVPFVTVTEKGTRNAVTADANGVFQIRISPLAPLVFTSTGFDPVEGTPEKDSGMLVTMKPNNNTRLEEIIVGGFRARPRKARDLKREARAAAAQPSVQAFPNPVTAGSALRISCRNLPEGSYLLELFSLSGQRMGQSEGSLSKGGSELNTPTTGLNAGNYILNITHKATGKRWSQQVIIRN